MLLRVFKDKVALGRTAAGQAATAIRRAIAERSGARIVAASRGLRTGVPECADPGARYRLAKVEAFHLDEASLLSSAWQRALTEESHGLAGS